MIKLDIRLCNTFVMNVYSPIYWSVLVVGKHETWVSNCKENNFIQASFQNMEQEYPENQIWVALLPVTDAVSPFSNVFSYLLIL